MRDLAHTLERINGRGYKTYKEIQGRRFRFNGFDLVALNRLRGACFLPAVPGDG